MEARPRRRKVLSRGVQAPGTQARPRRQRVPTTRRRRVPTPRRRRVPTPRRRGALVPNGAGTGPETTQSSRLSRRSSGRRHPAMLPSAPRSHPRRARGAPTEAPPPRASERRPQAAGRRTPRPRPVRRKVLSRGVQAPGMQAQPRRQEVPTTRRRKVPTPRRRRVPTPRRRGALAPNDAGTRPRTTHNSKLSRRSSRRRHPAMLPSAPRSHPRRTRWATTETPPPRTSERRAQAARRRTPRPRPVRRTVRTSRQARVLARAAARNYAYPLASVDGTYSKDGSRTGGAVRASSLTTRTTHAKTLPGQLRWPPTPSF